MRIVLISESCDRRTGIGRIVSSLASEFLESGHEVVCASQSFEDDQGKFVRRQVPRVPFSRGLSKLLFRFNALVLPESGVDIVHTFGVGRGAAVVSAQSCHRAGLSLLRSNRKDMLERDGVGLYDRVSLADERVLCTSPTTKKIIAVSRLVASQIEEEYGVSPQKIRVVPNGVDTALFEGLRDRTDRSDLRLRLGLDADTFVLLFVANEFGRKGLSALLRALSVLGDRNMHLIVVGGGDRAVYERLATDLKVTQSVRFAGIVPNPEQLYIAADAFVLPTFYEPFGLVVIEAMAAGLPVITSRMCGATEGMVHGKEVYHLDDPSSAEEVADAIATLKGNRLLRQNLVAAGLQKSREFAWRGIAQKILAVYGETPSS